jgi:ABC-2 type transport system ATP-binding protein
MEAVAEHGASVILSSHLIADLERVCDYLVVLVGSRVQVAGDIDDLLRTHHRLTGPRHSRDAIPDDQEVISESHTDRQSMLVVRTANPILDPAWSVAQLDLEDLVLAYMSRAVEQGRRPQLEVHS